MIIFTFVSLKKNSEIPQHLLFPSQVARSRPTSASNNSDKENQGSQGREGGSAAAAAGEESSSQSSRFVSRRAVVGVLYFTACSHLWTASFWR